MLTKLTQADRGFINRPVLTPHLQYRLLEKHQVLLVSEFFNTLLKGELFCNLLPFFDGSHSLSDITEAFEGSYSASEINGVIYSLSSKGYLVSAEHDLDQGKAAYWSTFGATPRWAEQKITSTRIAVVGPESHITKHLKESGANVVTSNADITVVGCHHYLESELHELNQRFIEQQSAWILVRPYGIEVMAGPVFCFDNDSACWDCLASRLRCHHEVHEFLRNAGGEGSAFKPGPNNGDLTEAVARLISAEILKWVVLKDSSAIHNHVLTLNTGKFETAIHKVIKRPQCLSCGDKELFDPNRKPLPLTLTSNPKSSLNSGGSRMVAPEITLAKYKHLVSPISGIATWLTRTTKETDPWLHVYWAGSNHGLPINTLNSLRHTPRSKSAGQGTNRTPPQVTA
ncbi:MAG: TOMM precursor leader peptide-binding protein, partial [Rhodobacteraceae bacterium]|nr:TOMM precursor leader peptide-binding protein [Paracoccaceae bacterium]